MYYITISNGLLEGDHQKKMGSAVWQFMWCLDKLTSVDEEGIGKVLGGKPIRLSEIPGSERNTSRNLNKLDKLGYLKLIHTPYGISIRVMKAKKKFGKRVDKSGVPNRSAKYGVPNTKYGVPNKTLQLDTTVDLEPKVSIWNFEEKLQDMEKNPDSYMDIIATFIREKGIKCDNAKQLSNVISRYCRIAKKIEGAYTQKQFFTAVDKVKKINERLKQKGLEEVDYTLETIYKSLTK